MEKQIEQLQDEIQQNAITAESKHDWASDKIGE
jgi:hypothetical protein